MTRTSLGCRVLIFLIIGGCSVPYILHNRNLERFRISFRSVVHPPSSALLAEFSEVGLLGGANGNHCDYLAGHVRESDQSPEKIKQHYAATRVPRVDPTALNDIGSDTHIAVDVVFPEADSRDGILRYTIPEVISTARAKRTKTTFFVVYALDVGYSPGGDVRCH
jgi:hypothetical protein